VLCVDRPAYTSRCHRHMDGLLQDLHSGCLNQLGAPAVHAVTV
jgi:hypothetical protein